MRSAKCVALVLSLTLNAATLLAVDTKLTCSEIAATEVKCKDYSAQTVACEAEVQAVVKTKIEAAKTALDECKKKHSFQYVIKCKKEIKNSTTAINTPKPIAAAPVQKELSAKADSACAKAEAIGNSAAVCKGPKKVLEALKANCIKDAAP